MINHGFVYIRVNSVLALFFISSFHISFGQSRGTEILWDNYGVPHIYAATRSEMYYALGWAEMNNHASLLLSLYGQARGSAAAYWGEEYLESDKQVLLFDLPGKGAAIYRQQTAECKKYIDAFVKGLNDFATSHPKKIDASLKQVLPVTGSDVFAHMERVLYRFLSNNERTATGRLFQPGSNAYAIGPSRSVTGNTFLAMLPHLPWKKDFTLLFEAHLNTGSMNAYGCTFVGFPMLFLAFNGHLGWTHTVNTLDASDRYELQLKDEGYILDGSVHPFIIQKKQIRIKQKDGSFRQEEMEIRKAAQGPVVGEKDGKAYAVRIAGLENAGMFEEYDRMMRARNWKEFESAIRPLQIPMFNIIYADDEKNIFYLFNGNVPVRPLGNFPFWRGTINGSESRFIWKNVLPYDSLPRLLNPATGFIQNSNDPPWTCTFPVILKPGNYRPYVAPQHMRFRPQRAVNMIREDHSISFESLEDYIQNTGVETADRFLDDLFSAVEKFPDTLAARAVEVLKHWDRKTDPGSRGALLFMEWFDKIDTSMFLFPWTLRSPVSTPDGLKDEKKAVALLRDAAVKMLARYGSLDIPFGEVYHFKINGRVYPASGGNEKYGIFRSFTYDDEMNKSFAIAGETFVALVEFSKPIKARVLLPYGNASEQGSIHAEDQLELLAEKKLRTALLTRKAVMEQLERREVLHFN